MKYLTDIQFVFWCLRGQPSHPKWTSYVYKHRDDAQLKRALDVMRCLSFQHPKMSDNERSELYESIVADNNKSTQKPRTLSILRRVAAVLCALIAIGGLVSVAVGILNRNNEANQPQSSLQTSIYNTEMAQNIRVINGNGVIDIPVGQSVNICCTTDAICVQQQTLALTTDQPIDILVPAQHRATVNLCDGTRVWINSNTKLRISTPQMGAVRAAELEGEAYFEVAHNPDSPFTVYSRTLNTVVKGTSFNICSTSTPNNTHYVVLVEGKVDVEVTSLGQSVTLNPSQILNYNNDCYMVTTTDVSKYISWKDGAIIIDSNSLQDVMSKLADYYNVEIVCSPSVSQLRCSGRLVLFDNIGQTLNVLTNIIPIGYRWADDKLYITEE